MLDGALTAGGATLTYGERGLGLLPPGGDRLRLEGAAEFFVGLGPPRRVPHYKYVGYGGGFVSRSVAGVEAAMSEYERDPRAFGRTTAVAPSTDHLDLGGFQDDDGPMEERPAGARRGLCIRSVRVAAWPPVPLVGDKYSRLLRTRIAARALQS